MVADRYSEVTRPEWEGSSYLEQIRTLGDIGSEKIMVPSGTDMVVVGLRLI